MCWLRGASGTPLPPCKGETTTGRGKTRHSPLPYPARPWVRPWGVRLLGAVRRRFLGRTWLWSPYSFANPLRENHTPTPPPSSSRLTGRGGSGVPLIERRAGGGVGRSESQSRLWLGLVMRLLGRLPLPAQRPPSRMWQCCLATSRGDYCGLNKIWLWKGLLI